MTCLINVDSIIHVRGGGFSDINDGDGMMIVMIVMVVG